MCTGEPLGHWPGRAWHEVYPRVYGGTEEAHHEEAVVEGLSPCVRGNLDQWRREAQALRVYPRVYGGTEYASQILY